MKLLMSLLHKIKATFILTLLIFVPLNNTSKANSTKYITVFVHGTLFPVLGMLNPVKFYTHSLNPDDRYYKCLANIRKNQIFQQDSIMLDEGLVKIEPLILTQYESQTLPNAISKKAAYQAIGAYHMVTQELTKELLNYGNCLYYTFGFSGALSDTDRQKAAHQLYKELVRVCNEQKETSSNLVINLCGYSHGGNILLYLAQAEDTYKEHLQINNLALFGTPIQHETAEFVHHPIFKKVINFYSDGDNVQNSDVISTKSRISFRTFKDLEQSRIKKNKFAATKKHNKIICDVHLCADNNTKAFNHFSFWFFDRYPVTKTNQANGVYNTLAPLPLVVLAPQLLDIVISSVNSSKIVEVNLIMKANKDSFILEAIESATGLVLGRSSNLANTIGKLQKNALTSWKPYALVTEADKIKTALLTAFDAFKS